MKSATLIARSRNRWISIDGTNWVVPSMDSVSEGFFRGPFSRIDCGRSATKLSTFLDPDFGRSACVACLGRREAMEWYRTCLERLVSCKSPFSVRTTTCCTSYRNFCCEGGGGGGGGVSGVMHNQWLLLGFS